MKFSRLIKVFLIVMVYISTIHLTTAQENIPIGIEMDSSQAILLGTSTDSLGNKLF